ncbi:MAG: hemerythrin domain-containing protein [candidate division NC10 bacterium]|nr:hemerythrin domain-containing protein [candidate division NC10 bacterium]
MKATDIFRQDHTIIRKALVSLDRALLMQTSQWTIVARNVATYLDIELREYLGSEERWVFHPLAETGPDATGVVAELTREHRDLEARLAEFKALTRPPIAEAAASTVREKGVALVKAFLHHMFLEEEVGFVLAEERLGTARLEEVADRVFLLQEAGRELEEPAAID